MSEEFSDTVRHLMLRTGDNQEDLGKVLGINRVGVSNRLAGKARWTLDDVEKLAAHWDVRAADLLLGPAFALDAYDKPVGKSSGQVTAIQGASAQSAPECD